MSARIFTAGFLFCGIGAGALGFVDAQVELRGTLGRFRSVGGIDLDAIACRSFERLTGSPALVADLATMTVEDLRVFWPEAPKVVFLSPPCKGFSGLMSPTKSATPKYQAMNRLAVAGVRLLLETWGTAGPDLILIENVPRIATRGQALVKEIRGLLRRAGYVTHEGSHDCGEVGGLAQHRQRFLMVARHAARCPVFLYQPEKQRVRGCGEVLGELPLPGDRAAGRLHQLPAISLRTWLRLAAIRPGKDWRDLETLDGEVRPNWARYSVTAWTEPSGAVAGSGTNSAWGVADVRVPGGWHRSVLGVMPWGQAFGTITGRGVVSTGAFAVADVRVTAERYAMNWRVLSGTAPAPTITGATDLQAGAPSIADLRLGLGGSTHSNILALGTWELPSRAVTGSTRPASGAPSVADLRLRAEANPRCYGVIGWSQPVATVTGNTAPGGGPFSVADLRLTCAPWNSSGVLGVLAWTQPAWTVTASGDLWTGWNAVSDPRVPNNPPLMVRWIPRDLDDAPPYVPVIPGRGDGSWHRPLTLLERAVLQGLPATLDGAPLDLEGTLSKVSEHIGNAVPVGAARAIAGEMLRTLVLAAAGAFLLSSGGGVWVKKARNGVFPLYTPKVVAKAKGARRRRGNSAAPRIQLPAVVEASLQ